MLDADNASVKGLSKIIGKNKEEVNKTNKKIENSDSEEASDNEYNSDDSFEPPGSDDSFSPPSSPKLAPPPGLDVPLNLEPVALVFLLLIYLIN